MKRKLKALATVIGLFLTMWLSGGLLAIVLIVPLAKSIERLLSLEGQE